MEENGIKEFEITDDLLVSGGLRFVNYRGLHDSIPNTYVIYKKKFEDKRELFYSFEEIGRSQEKLL